MNKTRRRKARARRKQKTAPRSKPRMWLDFETRSAMPLVVGLDPGHAEGVVVLFGANPTKPGTHYTFFDEGGNVTPEMWREAPHEKR